MKKIISSMVAIIILFIGMIVYFKPLSLSEIATEDSQLQMISCEYGVRNGEPYIDSTPYPTITSKQKNAILAVLADYPYQRTLGTLFSDGSDLDGNKFLYIYVYDDASQVNRLAVSSDGTIALHKRKYHMKNAEQFMEQILEIVEPAS